MYRVVFRRSLIGFVNSLWRPILFAFILGFIFHLVVGNQLPDNLGFRLTIKTAIYLFSMILMIWFGGYRNLLLAFLRKSSLQ
jgi:CBS domain containing-hemolysin-like protein